MIMAAIDIVGDLARAAGRAPAAANIGFTIAFALQGAIWARELILGVIRCVGDRPGRDHGLASAMAIISCSSRRPFRDRAIVILDNLGVDVTGLVAGLGIGGIAIGLAAQGIFSDLFAALSILFDKPFRRGDKISYGNEHRHGREDRPQNRPASSRSPASSGSSATPSF